MRAHHHLYRLLCLSGLLVLSQMLQIFCGTIAAPDPTPLPAPIRVVAPTDDDTTTTTTTTPLVESDFIPSAITASGLNFLKYARDPESEASPFISPLSLFFCLSLVANDPRFDRARAQILASYGTDGGPPPSIGALNRFAREMILAHKKTKKAGGVLHWGRRSSAYRFEIANAIWSRNFDETHRALVKTNFDAATHPLTGATTIEEINGWVATHTNNKITSVLETLPRDVTTIFVNAIYFKGMWKHGFKKPNTEMKPFRLTEHETISVPMMTQTNSFLYSEHETLGQIIALPYEYDTMLHQAPLEALVILPPESMNLDDFVVALPEHFGSNFLGPRRKQKIALDLPRFRSDSRNELMDFLDKNGVNAWSSSASNEEMTAIVQKVFVKVDEQGTEAAAATAAMSATSYTPPLRMECNRPFAFVLWDPQSGVASFVGLVSERRQFDNGV